MKFFSASLLILCSFFHAHSQDITGTWVGYIKLNTRYAHDVRRDYNSLDKDSLFMHMELKQENRKVTCVFYYARKEKQRRPFVIYKASALPDKKNPLDFFKITRDGIIQDNTKAQAATSFFKYMEATYLKSGNDEVLYGNWFDGYGFRWVYWIKKVNTAIGPHLQEIVDKENNR